MGKMIVNYGVTREREERRSEQVRSVHEPLFPGYGGF
jgi:hypothetical protein